MSTYRGVKAHLAKCLNSVLNVKALVGAFNPEKALVGAFSVIVKTDCQTDGALHSISIFFRLQETAARKVLSALRLLVKVNLRRISLSQSSGKRY